MATILRAVQAAESADEADVHRPAAMAPEAGAQEDSRSADEAADDGEQYEDEDEQYDGGEEGGPDAYR